MPYAITRAGQGCREIRETEYNLGKRCADCNFNNRETTGGLTWSGRGDDYLIRV